MSLIRACTGIVAAAGFLMLATVSGAVDVAPGAWAGEKSAHKRTARHRKGRDYAVEQGASPAEIARYFQLYGGYLDPSINKQTPGGPFDSGFFFDSGIGRNGGDSPYLN